VRRYLNLRATAGLVTVGIFVFLAIFGPLLSPDDPTRNTAATLQPPSGAHLLGTTQLGQDVLSQLLTGTRSSIVTAVLAAAIATVLSVAVGVSSGYLAGAGGELLSAFTNVFLVVPALPLVIVLSGYLHGGRTIQVAIVISVTGWAFGARVLRAQTLSLRRRDFVIAARAVGERPRRIITREILPQVLPIAASGFLLTIIFAVVTQASLAFLGLVDIGQWSWGTMLYWTESAQAFTEGAWWWFVPPGLCIALLGMGLALLNFSIDEFVNPRLRVARKAGRAANRRTAAAEAAPSAIAAPEVADRKLTLAPQPATPAVTLTPPPGVALAARALEVTYGEGSGAVRAVRDVDLELRRGSVLGIAGESGCGKSTMAFAIARLLQPPGQVTAGEVSFCGADGETVDLIGLEGEQLRRFRWERLALVPQAALNALNPVFTIGAQLRDVIVDHRGRKAWDELAPRRGEVLRLVGLSDDILRSYPHELSGGMRQRVMIAMAILLDPDVIIMDEPTTALDVVTQRQIIERLLVLQERLGLTIAFITHDVSLLLEIADTIAVMYAGRIVEVGPAAQIKADPQHPYTKGLLASFPPMTATGRRLTGIPGSPPEMGHVPPGCAFAPRCPHALDRCRDEVPTLAGDAHRSACWVFGPSATNGQAQRAAGAGVGA
jgi:peptide/nickel transport system permease protein